MVVSNISLSGLGRNDSHKKKLLIKYRFLIQAMEMPFLIRFLENWDLILFGNQVQLPIIQLKIGSCAIVVLYKL
jgi:predicted transcriptional regulator